MPKSLTKDELLAAAEHLENLFPPDIPLITSIYEIAIKNYPKDTEVLDPFAIFLLESDSDAKLAKKLLKRSIKLDNTGFQKYLYLAQLSKGKEALQALAKGVSNLEAEVKTDPKHRRTLSSAHCSIVDLFLTDLCDEPDAESRCKNHCWQALELDPENINAHHGMASYQRILGNIEEAKKHCSRFMELMSPVLKEALDEREDETLPGEDNVEEKFIDDLEVNGLPNRVLRLAMARLLIDLEMDSECELIVDSLLAEDEHDVESLLLQSWNYITGSHCEAAADAIEDLSETIERGELSPKLMKQATKELAELNEKLEKLIAETENTKE